MFVYVKKEMQSNDFLNNFLEIKILFVKVFFPALVTNSQSDANHIQITQTCSDHCGGGGYVHIFFST